MAPRRRARRPAVELSQEEQQDRTIRRRVNLTEELPGMPIQKIAPLPGNIVVILDQARTHNTAGDASKLFYC